jgi:hypothetical protein
MAKKDETEEPTSLAVNDAWTGLLVISFLALSVGTGFLVWDWMQYGDKPPPVPKGNLTPQSPVGGKKDAKEQKKEEPKKDEQKKEEQKADAHRPHSAPFWPASRGASDSSRHRYGLPVLAARYERLHYRPDGV